EEVDVVEAFFDSAFEEGNGFFGFALEGEGAGEVVVDDVVVGLEFELLAEEALAFGVVAAGEGFEGLGLESERVWGVLGEGCCGEEDGGKEGKEGTERSEI